MTSVQTVEQKRLEALETMLVFYLNDNKSGMKELRGPVSATNSFRIEFGKPPTQAEIEHLILILNAHKPALPTERDDRTPLELFNEHLAKDSQPLLGMVKS